VADQLDRVPNKAETCEVLHEEFTAENRRKIRVKRQQALTELKLIERMGKGVGVLR
jgi:hypothetical protein